MILFFFSSRRRHTRCLSDWSSDVCSSDLELAGPDVGVTPLVSRDPPECRRPMRVLLDLGERVVQEDRVSFESEILEAVGRLGRSEERRVGKEGRCRWWR